MVLMAKPNLPSLQPIVVRSFLPSPPHPHIPDRIYTYTQHHCLGLYPTSPSSRPLPWLWTYPCSYRTMVLEEAASLVRYWGSAESWCVDIQYPGSNEHPSSLKAHLQPKNGLVHLPTINHSH